MVGCVDKPRAQQWFSGQQVCPLHNRMTYKNERSQDNSWSLRQLFHATDLPEKVYVVTKVLERDVRRNNVV